MLRRALLSPVFVFSLAFPLLAHHSTAVFDLTRPASVSGVVTAFEWTNPHAHIYLDETKPDGGIVHWTVEIDSPNALHRMNWTKDSLKPGDRITCSGARAKDGSPRMRCTLVALEDGKLLRSN
ncbi:MAG TPA: DUF6152 family protein [Bryobacteraceae bacterium]|nr:DUF6152 family protein [Bryobacteraceae bacterium]